VKERTAVTKELKEAEKIVKLWAANGAKLCPNAEPKKE